MERGRIHATFAALIPMLPVTPHRLREAAE
jgi:hypothetical protein